MLFFPLFPSNKIGEITVKEPEFLDFEIRGKVNFVVLAENDLTSAACGVTVLIQDMNDNAPQFEQNSFKIPVWEGQAYNTYIMQVTSSLYLSMFQLF